MWIGRIQITDNIEDKKYWTVDEALKVTGLSHSELRKATRGKSLSIRQFGGHTLVPKEELLKILNEYKA